MRHAVRALCKRLGAIKDRDASPSSQCERWLLMTQQGLFKFAYFHRLKPLGVGARISPYELPYIAGAFESGQTANFKGLRFKVLGEVEETMKEWTI